MSGISCYDFERNFIASSFVASVIVSSNNRIVRRYLKIYTSLFLDKIITQIVIGVVNYVVRIKISQ